MARKIDKTSNVHGDIIISSFLAFLNYVFNSKSAGLGAGYTRLDAPSVFHFDHL